MPRYSYLRVRFSDANEFLAELGADRELVERGIVRVTTRRRPIHSGAVIRLELVAGAIVEGRPVLFERLAGDLWGHADDDGVTKAAQRDLDALEAGIVDLGLEVRPGLLEEVGE
jgi:hypothetical protein